jgi:hypothetical protein
LGFATGRTGLAFLAGSLLLLSGGIASAQAPAGGGAKKKGDEPQFDAEAERGRKKAEASREPATPEEALERALPIVTTWPSDAGENALRALVARGPDLVPLLKERLKGGTVLERAAAARGLCLLGEKDSFDEIARLFGDPRQLRRAGPLLASLHDLDPTRAGALALGLIDSEQSQLRAAATSFFKQHRSPATLLTLEERLVATRSESVRLDLFLLLMALDDPKLPEIALERWLGDPSPTLAARTTELLSWQESADVRSELARIATSGRGRRELHATLALALGEQRFGAVLLPDELFEQLLPMVRTSDMLLRATACVACGMIGLRSEARLEVRDAQVLPALADMVVHGRFFGDFELCFKASVRTLELLTGERLGESVPAWREWLAKNANAPMKGRRELKSFVLDEDVPGAVVTMTRTDARGDEKAKVALCGPDLRPAISVGERPGQLALTDAEMRGLLTALEPLLAAELPRRFEAPVDDGLLLRIESRGRERSLALAPSDARAASLEQQVRRAAAPETWQLLLPGGDAFGKAFVEEQAWFDTHPDPMARRSRLVDLALAQITVAEGAAAQQAFDVLARVEALGASVRAQQIDSIAALLSRLPPGDARSRKLIELLISTRRSDAFDRLVDALAPRGAGAIDPIADAAVALGTASDGVLDERPLVRVAALTAIERGRASAPDDATLVKLATSDPSDQVRARALALLARSGSDVAAATLSKIAREGAGQERVTALRLLGSIKSDEALQLLIGTARGADGQLAAAALEGLSLRADEPAASALEGFVRERGAGDAVGRLALAAIKGLPRDRALARLRKLEAEGDAAVSRESSYGLADLGEMQPVPTLLADLEDPKLRRRAQTLLTYLFCRDLGTEAWRFRSLHEAQPLATHSDHFLAALKEGGTDVPEAIDLQDQAAAPLLIAALEDSRWFVRRSALELLESATGRKLGSLPVGAGKEEIAELARRWREATSTQAQGPVDRPAEVPEDGQQR